MADARAAAGAGARGPAVFGGSLTFSLGWRFEQGAGFLAGLSLAVGVAVARALEAEGFAGIALKWPNDLIHRHLKFGGILIELNGDALGPSTAVIGIGLNVRLPGQRQGTSRSRSPTSRPSPAAARRRSTATGCSRALLSELADVLARYAREGFAPFAAEWQHRHAYQGKTVQPAAARRRRRHRQGRGRRRQRRAGAGRRAAPRALPVRRDLAAAGLTARRRRPRPADRIDPPSRRAIVLRPLNAR